MVFIFLILTIVLSLLSVIFADRLLQLLSYKYTKNHGIHSGEILRIGGSILYICLILIYFFYQYERIYLLIISFFFIFLTAIYDDLFGHISAVIRFFSIIFSATLAVFLFSKINIININFFPFNNDLFLFILSIIAISAITNSYNMIDGLNGLAIFSYIFPMFSLVMLNYITQSNINDCLILLTMLPLGILFFNFPKSLFFIGDSGAYLLGFIISTTIINEFNQNPLWLSWGAFLIIIYPITEMIFTVSRRLLNKNKIFSPDNLHLHSLLFKYLLKKYEIKRENANFLTSIFLFPIYLFGPVMVCFFYNNLNQLLSMIGLFIFLYSYVYLKVYAYRD